jgi:RNA recognition motif-containing protein
VAIEETVVEYDFGAGAGDVSGEEEAYGSSSMQAESTEASAAPAESMAPPAAGPAAREPKLFLANLPFTVSDEDLYELFAPYGTVRGDLV